MVAGLNDNAPKHIVKCIRQASGGIAELAAKFIEIRGNTKQESLAVKLMNQK